MANPWTSLPSAITVGVEKRIGPIQSIEVVRGGENNLLTAVLHGRDSTVFVKVVHGVSRPMRWLRNEITAGFLAPGIAPAVLFTEEDDGTLLVAFEYLAGRAVNLAPGSPDLALVATTVERLSALPAGKTKGLHQRWSAVGWWSQLSKTHPALVAGWDIALMDAWTALAPAAVEGDRLAHTDLHAGQFIVDSADRAYVIDWGWPAAAAPWIDTTYLVIRLIGAGHTPAQAEAWARALPAWSAAPDEPITAFAAFVAGLWTSFTVTDRSRGARQRAQMAQDYAAWRVAGAPPLSRVPPLGTATAVRNRCSAVSVPRGGERGGSRKRPLPAGTPVGLT